MTITAGDPQDGAAPAGETPAEPPVLRGLARAHFSGKEIAAILGVSAPMVSKWRHGRAALPPATQQFLTLLLAERVQTLAAVAPPSRRAEVEALGRDLAAQEALNGALPAQALHDGTRRFRNWWHARHYGPVEAAE